MTKLEGYKLYLQTKLSHYQDQAAWFENDILKLIKAYCKAIEQYKTQKEISVLVECFVQRLVQSVEECSIDYVECKREINEISTVLKVLDNPEEELTYENDVFDVLEDEEDNW